MEANSVPGRRDGALVGAADKGSPAALFTFDKKGYDPLGRAFHRIRPSNYDSALDGNPARLMTKTPPSGKGYDCGCRSTEDFRTSALFDGIVDAIFDAAEKAATAGVPGADAALKELKKKVKEATGRDFVDDLKRFLANALEGVFFRSFLVHIPSWVPVNRKDYGPTFDDAANAHNVTAGRESEVEVEGFLNRSYLTRHHRPYTQWSRYYHWSFQVAPIRGFRHLVGLGDVRIESEANEERKDGRVPGNSLYLGPHVPPRDPDSTLECLFDVGALTRPPADRGRLDVSQAPSIHYDKRWPFWPQSGDYFWAAGRFVYDCTHPTNKEKKGNNPGLHPTLINPVKAFAVSRYEAFKFDELDDFVPATRFMFFATRKGGYHDFDARNDIKFADKDYEFIVDLPPLDDDVGEFAVGRTPGFNVNTIVARPRLLKNIEFAPYGTGFDSPLLFAQVQPEIQLVRPEPGKLPRQLRVKVPMSKLPSDRDAYGFVLTLGWHDERQVAKVKKVAVKIPELTVRSRNNDLRFNVCVNGRWIFFPTTNPAGRNPNRFLDLHDGNPNRPGPDGLVLHLPDDGRVTITAQGTKRNRLGKFLEEKPTALAKQEDDRRLAVGGIIQISDEDARIIRELIKDKLGEDIPEGLFEDVDKVKELLSNESLRTILGGAADDLLGTRRIVDWKRDVDSIEADPKEQHKLASAIAREMKVFPVLNSANEAMGMVERNLQVVSQTIVQMSQLLELLRTNQPPLALTYQTMETVHPGETGFMFVESQDASSNGDYVLRCTVAASEPDPAPR